MTSITNDYDAANMSDLCGLTGAITVIFTHTDAAGNSATSSAVFTIEDTTLPTFVPNGGSVTVECDGTGNVAEIDARMEHGEQLHGHGQPWRCDAGEDHKHVD